MLSRVRWFFRFALPGRATPGRVLAFAVPVGAALVTLAALSGAANAAAARTAAVAHTAVVAAPAAARTGLSFYQTYGTQQGAVRGPDGQIWQIAMMPPEFQGNPTGSAAP